MVLMPKEMGSALPATLAPMASQLKTSGLISASSSRL